MQAIREIVTRDIFKNYEVPKEFGDEFEMILLPTKDLVYKGDNIDDLDKWEKFGNWEPNAHNMDMCSHTMLSNIDKKLGSEDYEAWQK